MAKRDQILDTFFQECEDLLDSLQEGLAAIEAGSSDHEDINSVFRAVHSIKGGAGAFGLDDLVDFAHGFESVLDEIREDTIEVDPALMGLLWRSSDLLSDLVAAARDNQPSDKSARTQLIAELSAARTNSDMDADSDLDLDFAPVSIPIDLDLPSTGGETGFSIRFAPHDQLYHNGNEVRLFLREIAALGDAEITCDQSNLPDLDDFEADKSYLSWRIHLTTDKTQDEIQAVFEFAEGLCDLEITPLDQPDDAGDDPGNGDQPQVAENLEPAPEAPGEIAPSTSPTKPKTAVNTVRVDVSKVDKLINLVGELVVTQAIISQKVAEMERSGSTNLDAGIDELQQLSREIQESVMAIRAQPIKPLFQRMSRIVREASAATGKVTQLHLVGEMTEIDKTVIEQLADPLTHMLRNAVDHGLETPTERKTQGKPEVGTVTLRAEHRSGRVLIEVTDDGAGINRDRVRQIAENKGLVAKDAPLSDEEIDALLFLPGFSTVGEVSELSGRGVGMDVVKRAIRSLGGRISVTSAPGTGSTFAISLPLTLAVLDGMVVEVAGQRAILPITSIIETLRPGSEKIHPIGTKQRLISVRGEFVRVVDVGYSLGFRGRLPDLRASVLILVESEDGTRSALAFDTIHDQRQVVIKSLETNYGKVPGVAAATILGDGKIALILDPNDLAFRDVSTPPSPVPVLRKAG